MTPQDEPPEDALSRTYRRESAADAGRPAPATRAAILAEARAVAQRRLRENNRSRLPWAVAASVAVLGFAIAIWHQTGPQQEARRSALPAPDQPPVEMAAVTDKPGPPALPQPAPAETTVVAARAKRSAEPTRMPASPPAPPEVPAAPAASALALAKAEAPATREMRADATDSARVEGAAAGRTQGVANASAAAELRTTGLVADARQSATLLKQQFPAEYESATPPQALWLLRDANGTVLRTGTLRENAPLQSLDAEIQRAYPGQRISAWVVTRLVNARGAPVSLAMATLQ